jgi:hypothetical protein
VTNGGKRSGAGSNGDDSTPKPASGSGSGRREPRIGRRTIPPDAATTPTPAKPGKPASGSGGSSGSGTKPSKQQGDGARTSPPSGLRSAGTRSSRPATRRPSTAPAERSTGRGAAPARRQGGILSAFRQPSVYPKLGETFAAGSRAVLRSAVLVVGGMLLVIVLWFVLLAIGLDHVPSYSQLLLAMPPLSSFFDLNLAYSITGLDYAWIALVIGMTVVRAAIFAVITSLVVERLDAGRASMAGVLRGLRFIPAFIGIYFVNVALIFAPQVFSPILGSTIGGLIFFAALVGGVHFLSFASIIVIRNGTNARTALGTSVRAARMPGSRHVGMVLLYFTLVFLAPAFVPMSSAFTVNPSIGIWAMILGVSLFNLVVIGGFAYRFGVIEEDVPPPAPRRERQPLFGARRR